MSYFRFNTIVWVNSVLFIWFDAHFYSKRERAFRRASFWVCRSVASGFVFFSLCDEMMREKTHLRRPIPNSIKNIRNSMKFMQNWARSVRNGAKRHPKGAKMEPKRPKRDQNGAKRAQHWPKWRRKVTKMHPKIDARKKVGSGTHPVIRGTGFLEPLWSKRSPRGWILGAILESFSIKNAIKKRARNRTWKNMKIHEKSMKKQCKNRPTFYENSCNFRPCDFSFFAKSPSLKWDFHKIIVAENSKKSMKNQSKNKLETSMLESSKNH